MVKQMAGNFHIWYAWLISVVGLVIILCSSVSVFAIML